MGVGDPRWAVALAARSARRKLGDRPSRSDGRRSQPGRAGGFPERRRSPG